MRRSGWLSGTVAVLVTVGGCTADGGRAVGRGAERLALTVTTAGAAGVAVGSVRTLAGMTVPRATHTATLLRDGTVLVAGGFGRGSGAELATTERYSPATGRFAPGPRMTTPRMGHSATLLPDGRVLLAGGTGPGFDFLASAELYDPRTGRFAATGSMAQRREGFTATLLGDGHVLVTGGHVGRHEQIEIHRSAELYDPHTGRFTHTGDMIVPRHKHDAVLLADERVLLVGGADEHDDAGLYHSAELYDPQTGRFQPTGDLRNARYKLRGTSVLLGDGRVLVAGGA